VGNRCRQPDLRVGSAAFSLDLTVAKDSSEDARNATTSTLSALAAPAQSEHKYNSSSSGTASVLRTPRFAISIFRFYSYGWSKSSVGTLKGRKQQLAQITV
jgi:hypothetical protein